MRKSILTISCLIVITACQPVSKYEANTQSAETFLYPSENEIKSTKIEPLPSNYQEIIKRYHIMTLKDPDSAKYDFYGTPQKAYGLRRNRKPVFGWLINLQVNAKNGYGAYTGYQLEKFILEKNKDGNWYAISMDSNSKIIKIED